jgi:hypothetical protein
MARAPHPRVVDPAHPLVQRIRDIALAYPEAAEVEAWGRPTFRAGKKTFVMVSASMDRPFTIVFKPEADERLAYLADARLYSPPYWGPGRMARHGDRRPGRRLDRARRDHRHVVPAGGSGAPDPRFGQMSPKPLV